MNLESINYKGVNYIVVTIPNVFYDSDEPLILGSESLNKALYDNNNGYQDKEAIWIDESIYAYMDDKYFNLNEASFIEKAKSFLD